MIRNESLFGIPVRKSEFIPDKQPVLRLSERVIVSPEFRADFDKWLLDMFGEHSVAYMINGNLIMNPLHLDALKLCMKS